MSNNKWTEAHLNMVGAGSASFPDLPVTHWLAAKAVPVAVREVLKETGAQMDAIEESRDYTPDGALARTRAIARDAIAKLQARSKIDDARSAADRRKAALASKKPKPAPKDAEQIAMAAEIRRHVAGVDKAEKLMFASRMVRESPQAADAILAAPGFLTGLSEAELTVLRSVLPVDESPEGKEISAIDVALKVLDGTMTSATGMIAARAGLRRGPDGSFA